MDEVEFLRGCLRDGVPPERARVVDQDVDPAELGDDGFDARDAVVFVAQIQLERQSVRAECLDLGGDGADSDSDSDGDSVEEKKKKQEGIFKYY